jgi:hypothetical protein
LENHHLEDLDIDGRIILRWVLRRQDVRGNTAVAIPCEHHNESSDSRWGISSSAEWLLAFQEKFCSMEFIWIVPAYLYLFSTSTGILTSSEPDSDTYNLSVTSLMKCTIRSQLKLWGPNLFQFWYQWVQINFINVVIMDGFIFYYKMIIQYCFTCLHYKQ